jgi:hypothetical protein
LLLRQKGAGLLLRVLPAGGGESSRCQQELLPE